MKKNYLAKIVITLILIISTAMAGTTGKIMGTVVDKSTGQPMMGVNVQIQGTSLGAATDANGHYSIINIPPGTYTLRFSMIGYQTVRVTKVKVNIDLTTNIDVEMGTADIQGEAIEVVAEEKMIQKDITASSSRVSSDELENIPVENFSEVVNRQAGVVAGHFRGGRSGETLYMVDGMPVTDPFSGGMATNVENEAIKELEVITGSFNAEYGKAMSGVVNIVTKDGSNEFNAGMQTYTGQFYTVGHNNIYPHVQRFNPLNINNLQGYASGALIKDKLFFYVNGRYFREDGYFYGRKIFNTDDVFHKAANEQDILVTSDRTVVDSISSLIAGNADADSTSYILATGDSSWVPMDTYEKLNLNTKLTWKINDQLTLSYNIVSENPMNFLDKSVVDHMTYKDYNNAFKYNPNGTLTRENYNYNQTLKLTHQLTGKTFYNLGLSQFNTNYKEYYFDDPTNPMYGTLSSQLADLPPNTYNIGGIENHHYDRNTTTTILRGDLTSQVNRRHKIKTGIEIQHNRLKYYDNYYDIATGRSQGDTLDANPIQMAAYIQDKIEFSDIIVNAGIRLDYFDPRAKVPAEPTDPNIDNPLRPSVQDLSRSELEEIWWDDVNPKIQISPRLGLAYPITDQGVIHISYGHFFQMPNFQQLYANPDWELSDGMMGNPDLDAKQTISYEIGLQQQLSQNFKLQTDYYVRDVRGWINLARRIRARNDQYYTQYVNSEYATIKGVTLELSRRLADGYSFSLNYTFQIAEGTQSDPNAGIIRLASGQMIEKQVLPLDWDQRHTINGNLVIGNPGTWMSSFLLTIGSGTPYDAVALRTPSPFVGNDGRQPVFVNIDFKTTRTFDFFGIKNTFYIKVDNLFDIANETNVYGDSGRSTYSRSETIYENSHSDFSKQVNTLEEYFNDPGRFSSPMRVTVGYKVEI
ncbi:MAG TPA: TonB-dependent receptor [bacterium]|nr:TonB-dependent receptor [bacterium]